MKNSTSVDWESVGLGLTQFYECLDFRVPICEMTGAFQDSVTPLSSGSL